MSTIGRSPRASERPRGVRQRVKRYAKEAYREAILQAAERVFVRVGYHQAKMTDLAQEVGVSTGTLYNYFESKESVFSSLVERARHDFLRVLEEAREQHESIERVRAIARAALSYCEERGALVAIFTQLGAVTEGDLRRVGGPDAEEGYLTYLRMLSDALRDAQRAGQVRSDVPVKLLSGALAGSLNGAIFAWAHGDQQQGLAASADAILALFVEGAGPR